MALDEDKAQEIMKLLIAKENTPAETIPAVFKSILAVHNELFAPPEPEKKRRKYRKSDKVRGWPQGLSHKEYAQWKDNLPASYEGPITPRACMEQMENRDNIIPDTAEPATTLDTTVPTPEASPYKHASTPEDDGYVIA